MGKLLEELILLRLQTFLVGENGLSENRLGFSKGRRRGTGKRKGFCVLISIYIRNAFNTATWKICIEAMVQKKVPDYLLRMIDDYLSDRLVIYEFNKWSVEEEMTCGAP